MNRIALWGFIALLCGFLFMILLMVNPPAEEAVKTPPPPGNISVIVTWQDGDSDVDTWLMAPEEPAPVGYSNKNGAVWDLLRDDTGLGSHDALKSNFENAYTSFLPDGEYVVNVHAYGLMDPLPFTVSVEVLLNTGGSSMDRIYAGSVQFDAKGEEITVVRFRVLDGALVRSSINNVPVKLRSGEK
jgi:hypothetical protein